jgi:hypothetical protein
MYKCSRLEKERLKLQSEEVPMASALRKAQFNLQMANWDVEKWEHQLDLLNSEL